MWASGGWRRLSELSPWPPLSGPSWQTYLFPSAVSSGIQIAGQVCPWGRWGLNVLGSGETGEYRLTAYLEKFTGTIDIREVRQ